MAEYDAPTLIKLYEIAVKIAAEVERQADILEEIRDLLKEQRK